MGSVQLIFFNFYFQRSSLDKLPFSQRVGLGRKACFDLFLWTQVSESRGEQVNSPANEVILGEEKPRRHCTLWSVDLSMIIFQQLPFRVTSLVVGLQPGNPNRKV